MHFRCCTYLYGNSARLSAISLGVFFLTLVSSLPSLLYVDNALHRIVDQLHFSYCLLCNLRQVTVATINRQVTKNGAQDTCHNSTLEAQLLAYHLSLLILCLPFLPLFVCVSLICVVLGLFLKWSKTISESCLYAALATRLPQLRACERWTSAAYVQVINLRLYDFVSVDIQFIVFY